MPQTIGPYRILEVLGRGGMGVVYRAERLDTRQQAAVKTVRVPHAELLQSLRREIQSLARIRHPGVVRILEEGLDEGLPWYAMELLEGLTLRRWREQIAGPALAQAPDGTAAAWWSGAVEAATNAAVVAVTATGPQGAVPLQPVLSLVRRLCGPLAFLHGEGIVHRDLKPDNVLVTPGGGPGAPPGSIGMPVLVDFGLSAQFSGELSREALAVEGLSSGTAAYMAPEQHLGELVDARVDLYALGCILYELLCGRPPFTGTTRDTLRRAHLEATPVPPSRLVPEIPARLDELVLRLLAKQPRDRLGHADDLAAGLAELGAEDGGWDEAPRPRAYLYRPGFAARQEALDLLEGTEALVLVGGESGIGKTRLVLETALQAQARGTLVLTGDCQPEGGPLHPLRRPMQALADRARQDGAAETERLLGRRAQVLALYEPALRGLPGQVEAQDVAPLPPEDARLRLLAALAESLGALPGRVLLVLDDLQWADGLTLGFLEHVLQAGTGSSLPAAQMQMIGTYRTEEAGEGLQRLLERPDVRALRLGRLGEPAVGAMVGDMLALRPAPPLFVRFLTHRSEGNPFFVAEYLRTAVAEGLLFRDALGRWQVQAEGEASESLYEQLTLPRSLLDLVRRRLGSLSAEARALAEAGAVLGRELDAAVLEAMAQRVGTMPGGDFLRSVDELLRRQVLEEPAAGGLRFVHDKLREVAYAGLPEAGRRRLHQAAAETLEAKPGDGAELAWLAALGHHWEQAAAAARARPCYLGAARKAVARHAHAEAERLYRAHLRLAEAPDPESIAARNELASKVLFIQARGQEAAAEHALALEEARGLGESALEAESLLGLGLVHGTTGQPARSMELQLQALAIAEALGDPRLRALGLKGVARIHRDQGRMEEARSLYEQVLLIYRDLDEPGTQGRVLSDLGLTFMDQARHAEAQPLYEQALLLARQCGDPILEGNALANLALLRYAQGHLQDSAARLESALEIYRRTGDRRGEATVLGNLGMVLHEQGRFQEARGVLEQALRLHRQGGDRRSEGIDLNNLGNLSLALEQFEEAAVFLEQSIELDRQLDNKGILGRALHNLAIVRSRQGQAQMARGLYEQALSLHREVSDRPAEEATLQPLEAMGQPLVAP